MNIEEVEEPKERKSTSFLVKTPLKTIPDQRKVRELPRKMNLEEKLKSRKSTRIATPNPFQTLSRASQNTEKHKNYHEKRICKKLKSRKARKFTCKTRSRRSPPPPTSDLAPRPFTTTVRTPGVNHTVWGKNTSRKTQKHNRTKTLTQTQKNTKTQPHKNTNTNTKTQNANTQTRKNTNP